ncbi:hypothetical protein BD309DRAFT_856433 [Dichomitus squalens]|uniref:Uncharacterized protein n=1 Tax=Dichomitus squalens TaxID=114155 RepID=A0A4Q9P3B5_9APHY|nr:hypothetical protein BD309DRAFT_856433 [Dichomitus squalens]TBU63155.1 hypothetical protein BD310DRAFT_808951 [Dichomitus squalens]
MPAIGAATDAGNVSHITSLPTSTTNKLRSTQILTSLPQLVSELVQNSVDAGARNIEISIDPEDWECWVRDDGTGISRDGLAVLASGPEAGRYGTSKACNTASLDEVDSFGFRGEALASIANLCCLEITSRTRESSESWTIILKGDQTLYTGPSTRWRRESSGTVVSVRDAFYNLPIRRKAHPNCPRTVELVRRDVEALALVFPDICFAVENVQKTKDATRAKAKTRLLTVPKTSSTVLTFRHLYGKALATHVEEIDQSYAEMKLEGFVSLDGAYSKAYQFLYINRHPLETCSLHRSVEGIFARTSFYKHVRRQTILMLAHLRLAVGRSPRKVEKKPVYVLNLTIPPRFIDNTVEPSKAAVQLQNSASATAFLSSVVQSVLIRHGFLPRRPQKPVLNPEKPSPRKKWKLTHVGVPDRSGTSLMHHFNRSSSQPVLVPTRTDVLLRHESVPEISDRSDGGLIVGESEDAPDITWKNPATGEVFVVDARTGNSVPQHFLAGVSSDAVSGAPLARARLSLGEFDAAKTSAAPAWISNALEANDAYKLVERKIPILGPSFDFAQQQVSERCSEGVSIRKHAHPQPFSQRWDGSNLTRFSKDDLRGARILGQVDWKFIACVFSTTTDNETEPAGNQCEGGGALVLIDQHAADERIRVERFLREVCEGFLSHPRRPVPARSERDVFEGGVRTRKLDPPVQILLTGPEAKRIAGSHGVREVFKRWGVAFSAPEAPSTSAPTADSGAEHASYVQIPVGAVPEVVADKLLAGEELRDLVRGFLARLEADGIHEVMSLREDGDISNWQKALRWCPRELVELINSKACRGAIMFNDTLTFEQCKALVAKLCETDLPFQCAHGRPSLVPLVDTSGARNMAGLRPGPGIDWGEFMRHR